jgi:hypothetical protein
MRFKEKPKKERALLGRRVVIKKNRLGVLGPRKFVLISCLDASVPARWIRILAQVLKGRSAGLRERSRSNSSFSRPHKAVQIRDIS